MPMYAPNYKSKTTPPAAKHNTIHYPLTHSPLYLTALPNHLTIHSPIHPSQSRPPPTCTRTRGNENLWSTSLVCAYTRQGKINQRISTKISAPNLPQTYPKLCNKSCPNFTQNLTKYLPKYLHIFMEILPWFYCMLHAANRSFHDHKGAMNHIVN